MMRAWNDADVLYREFPYSDKNNVYLIVATLRPNYKGLLVVKDKKTNLMGYMNELGKVVIPCKYYCAMPFMENGLALVFADKDKKKGFINVKGEEVIPPVYDYATWEFLDNITPLIKDNRLLFINKDNEITSQWGGGYYTKLQTAKLDKYILILNSKTGKFDMFDTMGERKEKEIDSIDNNINNLLRVFKKEKKEGEKEVLKEIYSCYKNWN